MIHLRLQPDVFWELTVGQFLDLLETFNAANRIEEPDGKEKQMGSRVRKL